MKYIETTFVLYEFKDAIIPSWKCEKYDGISPIYPRFCPFCGRKNINYVEEKKND